MSNVIHELQADHNGEFNICRYIAVAVKDYGSEGCEPIRRSDCNLTSEHVSCVGSSGNNMCGHFMGFCGNQVVRCSLTGKENK